MNRILKWIDRLCVDLLEQLVIFKKFHQMYPILCLRRPITSTLAWWRRRYCTYDMISCTIYVNSTVANKLRRNVKAHPGQER